MFIIMLQTRRGSEDGFAVRCFQKGCRYDVAESLARYFIHARIACECDPSKGEPYVHTV